MRAWLLLSLFATTVAVCEAQTVVPSSLPELKYPQIARIAHVEGDVVVSFRQTPEGGVADATPISGPALLRGTAVENVKLWRFEPDAKLAGQAYKVTFHFQLDPPPDGFDDNPSPTKVVVEGPARVQVISISTTGLERSECPTASDRVLPAKVIEGDFVALQRWNEDVRVNADGSIVWEQGKVSRTGQITPAQAIALLERFRAPVVWNLCGHYAQAGLMDGDGSSFKVRIGGREKSVGEYGAAAPPIFREVELAVDVAANTHQWRHGDPRTESIIEIGAEYLPKPGKTKLMDAAQRGDEAAYQAALAAGDKLTDVDDSGWTPLMYAAGSYGESQIGEILFTGVNVNARSMRGETALMASAVGGYADEGLLDAGAEVNAANDDGMTALMLLVQHGRPDEIEIFLKAGADARKKDAEGRTALDYLNAVNCGSQIVQKKDPQWGSFEYSKCNAFDADDYRKSKRLLTNAGAKETRTAVPAPKR